MNINEILESVLSGNPDIDIDALRQAASEKDAELQETKDVLEGLSPLMASLENAPELADLISKFDAEGLKKFTEEVTKTLGKETKSSATNMDIKNMDEGRLAELVSQAVSHAFDTKAAPEIQKLREEAEVAKAADSMLAFINSTPDFSLYHEKIEELSKANPDVTDIKMLYLAAKGDMGDVALEAKINERAAEIAKAMATGMVPNGVTINGERAPMRNKELVSQFFAPVDDASLSY